VVSELEGSNTQNSTNSATAVLVYPELIMLGSHFMSRRYIIVCALIVFAFGSAASGCSSPSNPTLVSHAGAADRQRITQSVGSWTTKAPIPTARYLLAAGVISGNFYAIGGDNGTGRGLNTVEAYNTATDTWTTKAPMPTARFGLAVGGGNGKLYAVGGYNGNYLSTAEAHKPATDTWTAKASMPTSRVNLAVGMINGKLYAVGGYNGSYLSTVEAYDPTSNTWTTKASMPTAREFLAVGVVDSILYAVGGFTGNNYLNTVEAFSKD
jgi:hypothetical protein